MPQYPVVLKAIRACRTVYATDEHALWDIVYQPYQQDGLWHCCGTDDQERRLCLQGATNDTFDAPAPSELTMMFSEPPNGWNATSTSIAFVTVLPSASISVSASTTASVSTTAPALSQSSTPPIVTHKKGGLSAGAIAGILIGAVAAMALVALALWVVRIRRKKRRDSHGASTELLDKPPQQQYFGESHAYPHIGTQPSELPEHGGVMVHELPGRDPSGGYR